MDLDTLLSYEWGIMAPEFVILGVATLLSLIDLFMGQNKSRKPLAWLGIAGIVVAIIFLVGSFDKDVTSILYDTYRLDSFGKAFKLLLLVGAGLVLLLSMSYQPKDKLEYRGEFYYLFLTALLGAMIMTSSGDMITLFVGLELLSISSYILAGLRKKNQLSNESAMKYVVNGGIATALTLFGMSYIYGLTGTTNVIEIAYQLSTIYDTNLQYMLSLAFLIMFVGLAFKLAAAPFHMWAPDVYQGAPTPVTAFLSVVSKTAGFVIIMRLFLSIFPRTPAGGTSGNWMFFEMQDYIAFLAGASMIIGNTIALKQRNVKRMLAYSSIAHAGYVLVAFVTLSPFMIDTIWFYLAAYLLMNLGAFAVLQLITDKSGSEDISQFAGLYKRSPILAVTMTIFILSLAGIPGTAGFIGKLNIFISAFASVPSHYVLASILIVTTVISYFYYFGILTQMFFRPAPSQGAFNVSFGVIAVIVICAIGTILLGLLPGIAFDFLYDTFNYFNDFVR
ncbi:NADH-quinone oxidoreductase subunit NuoN [Bacillus sp. SCS-151]|uniref:NADH-quinone oxidoreductase subunit NuoN n=1 Tax=Nanhaiella sioensis TaxID=3115293 RepID=UPI00397E613C